MFDILRDNPALKKTLDLSGAYYATEPGVWLESVQLKQDGPEPVIVLIDGEANGGQGTILQWINGNIVGGMTLRAR